MVHGQKFGLNIWVSILVQQYANTLMVHGQKFGLNIWVSILVQQYANTLRQDTDNLLGGAPTSICHFFCTSVCCALYLRNRVSSDPNFW